MPTLSAGPQPRAAEPGISAVTVPTGIFAAESRAIQRMGRNMQRAGGTIVNIAASAEHAQYVEQHENGLLEFEQLQIENLKERAKSKDYDNWASDWSVKAKAFQAELLDKTTNDKAREELKKELQILSDKHEVKIWTAARNQRIEDIKQRQPIMERKFAEAWHDAGIGKEKNAVLTAYEIDLKAKEENGLLTKPFEEYMRDYTRTLGGVAIERNPVLAKEMLAEGGDISVLVDEKLIKYLEAEDYRALRELAASKVRYQEAGRKNLERVIKEKQEAAQTKNWKDTWVKIKEGTLIDPTKIVDMVANEEITRSAGESLLKQMEDGSPQKSADKALLESGIIKNELRDGDITEFKAFDKLQALDLSDDDRTAAVKDLESAARVDDPLKSTEAVFYLKNIKELYWPAGKGPGDGVIKTAEDWDRTNRGMENYIKENPDAAPKQLADKYHSLTEQFMKRSFTEWLKSILDVPLRVGEGVAQGLGWPWSAIPTKSKTKEKAKTSGEYTIGQEVTVNSKKYKVESFRESDGEPMMVPVK